MKMKEFLRIAEQLNQRLGIIPLLFGSLGLEQRLEADLKSDDIDVLIPENYLNNEWENITALMNDNGYTLYDIHEHAFEKDGLSIAFASLENLTPFAGVEISEIPVIDENRIYYKLLNLSDYLKVYIASSKDGYRKNTKNKNDQQKIDLIIKALGTFKM